MADKAWKQAERRFAKLFGTRRRPLSGGNQGGGRDDSMHEVLFLEHKLCSTSAIWTLHDKTKDLAKKENRTPVIGISLRRRPGILIVVSSQNLDVLLEEYAKAQGLKLVKDEKWMRKQLKERKTSLKT